MGTPAREYPETRLRVGPIERVDGMRVSMAVGPWMTVPSGEQTAVASTRVPAPRPTADDQIGPLGAAAAHGARPAGVALATGPAPAAVAPMAARLVVRPTEAFGNGSGTMHGGVLFACTDLAAAGLAGALGPQPALDDTTPVRMNLLRPAVLDEPVIFTLGS